MTKEKVIVTDIEKFDGHFWWAKLGFCRKVYYLENSWPLTSGFKDIKPNITKFQIKKLHRYIFNLKNIFCWSNIRVFREIPENRWGVSTPVTQYAEHIFILLLFHK